MNSIIFGADGTLYFQNDPEAPLISANNVFRFSQKSFPGKDLGLDFSFWANYLTKDVYFEEGLTVKKFMECLLPWVDFFSHFTQVDLKGYYNEMKEPIDVENTHYISIDYIMLYENISFHPARMEDIVMKKWGKTQPVQINPSYEVSTGFSLSGFKMESELPIDLSYVPMQYIADTPVILQHSRTVQYGDWLKKEQSRITKTLTMDENIYGIKHTADGTPFIEGYEDAVSLEVMLRSFFRYIFRDIQKRDNGKRIKVELKKVEEGNTDNVLSFPRSGIKNKNNDVSQESIEDAHNVIQVPFKQISKEKQFFEAIESSLVQRILDDRVLEEALVSYERKQNPNERTEHGEVSIAVPPENRKSNIGLVNDEDF